jgi:hypothetical protein
MPILNSREILERKFSVKVSKQGDEKCWLWIGGKTSDGYGMLDVNSKKYYAHRLSYELYRGPIPKGLCVCHHCDNPSCVNPSHLFLGSKGDNIRDCVSKGRRGNCNKKLTSEKVVEIREMRKKGMSLRKIASMFGIHNQTVHNVVTRKHWKEV